jgi:pimeloyl-ACP methyl ester carboxylesterase
VPIVPGSDRPRRVRWFEHGPLRFEVDDGGPADGQPVVLLHGFPADRRCWSAVLGPLQAAGCRTLSPDQRGYSPGACPPGRRSYRIDLLAGDVLALADAAGLGRFHLVGHDWGAVVAWHLAAAAPQRVATVTALSVPHPGALRAALLRSTQVARSWYVAAFQVPGFERLLGVAGGACLSAFLAASGLPSDDAARYAARAAGPGGLRGPLGWYRALPLALGVPTGPCRRPATLVWGRRDRFVGAAAAHGCAAWVDAPYRLVELDASHWLPECSADAVAAEVLRAVVEHPLEGPSPLHAR